MTDQEYDVVEKMKKYGGSFIKALAQCFQHADEANFEKLKNVFLDDWEHYEQSNF